MGQTAKRQRDGTWRSAAAVIVLKEGGTQTLGTYIDKRHATVVEWVVLSKIPDVCNRDLGSEGGRGPVIRGGVKQRLRSILVRR